MWPMLSSIVLLDLNTSLFKKSLSHRPLKRAILFFVDLIMNKILNIAAYKFIALPVEELENWRQLFKNQAASSRLKGTILLSQEGVNLFLAGFSEDIAQFQVFLRNFPEFEDMVFRQSWSENLP